ncbi:MAG: hypothetical protein J6B92_04850, partial [Paraprevotella sp.]|nr:hypothetical protein [Paraprevotella sp.]
MRKPVRRGAGLIRRPIYNKVRAYINYIARTGRASGRRPESPTGAQSGTERSGSPNFRRHGGGYSPSSGSIIARA